MDEWKRSFAKRIGHVRSNWAGQLDAALDATVMPVFEEFTEFLRENGFDAAVPMQDGGHRSLKFELAENAYVLLIFASKALDEFEFSRELFVLGQEPDSETSVERVSSLDRPWVQGQFQAALDAFVEVLESRVNTNAPVEVEVEAAVV